MYLDHYDRQRELVEQNFLLQCSDYTRLVFVEELDATISKTILELVYKIYH